VKDGTLPALEGMHTFIVPIRGRVVFGLVGLECFVRPKTTFKFWYLSSAGLASAFITLLFILAVWSCVMPVELSLGKFSIDAFNGQCGCYWSDLTPIAAMNGQRVASAIWSKDVVPGIYLTGSETAVIGAPIPSRRSVGIVLRFWLILLVSVVVLLSWFGYFCVQWSRPEKSSPYGAFPVTGAGKGKGGNH